jgi:hypothetical protein
MCLLHPENKSLHQLASIATNKLCEFIRLFLVALKEKLMMQLSPPAHLKNKHKNPAHQTKKTTPSSDESLNFFLRACAW